MYRNLGLFQRFTGFGEVHYFIGNFPDINALGALYRAQRMLHYVPYIELSECSMCAGMHPLSIASRPSTFSNLLMPEKWKLLLGVHASELSEASEGHRHTDSSTQINHQTSRLVCYSIVSQISLLAMFSTLTLACFKGGLMRTPPTLRPSSWLTSY